MSPSPSTAQSTDLFCTFSTSGTTSNPKLAVHDQNTLSLHSQRLVDAFDIRPGDSMLCPLPFYVVLGMTLALSALAGQALCVAMEIFDAEVAAGLIERLRITHFAGSDTMLAPGHDLSSWRRGTFGNYSGRDGLVKEAEARWNTCLTGAYGSSECMSLLAVQHAEDSADIRSVCGGHLLHPEMQTRVVDIDQGRPLTDGQIGELQFRGGTVMRGYMGNETATTSAFTEDGWYRSGDLGTTSGRRIRFISRIANSLRLGGYLVDPSEIEKFLLTQPAIRAAAVVGADLPGKGAVAVAFVEQDAAGEASEAELLRLCRQSVANYKVPSRIITLARLPVISGPNGDKVHRASLEADAQKLIEG